MIEKKGRFMDIKLSNLENEQLRLLGLKDFQRKVAKVQRRKALEIGRKMQSFLFFPLRLGDFAFKFFF